MGPRAGLGKAEKENFVDCEVPEFRHPVRSLDTWLTP